MSKLAWMNAEADFESAFSGRKSCWCYAFEDTREAMGLGKSRRVFTKGRPSDYLVVAQGLTFFAEVKSSQSDTSFNLNNIEDVQWQAAIRSVAAGGLYFFFIRSEVRGKWYQVPASILVEQRKTKKSIKWDEITLYFWKDANGNHPTPFTNITAEDMEAGIWQTSEQSDSKVTLEYL